MKIQTFLKKQKSIIDDQLLQLIDEYKDAPETIVEAMRYSLTSGGKRVRPILCLMVLNLFEKTREEDLNCACALDFLHTYTLIHDDLPCMDNDDLRRGKPTLHKVYPESIALLAGDALLTSTFSIIAKNTFNKPQIGLEIIQELSVLTGASGVIGGQVLDLESEDKNISLEELQNIHMNKTAKLIIASAKMGARLGRASVDELKLIEHYASSIGVAFQIADDILDETGDSEKMGKQTGQDKKLNKSTYPKFFGIKKSKQILEETVQKAIESIKIFGGKGKRLEELALFIANRDQ